MGKDALIASLDSLDKSLIFFGILVAIGVVGESVSGWLHWRRSGELQRIQTQENLALQKEVWASRAAFEKYKAARDLSSEQRGRIAEALKPFAGTPFQLNMYPGDGESVHLANQIEEILAAAGWDRVPVTGTPLGLVSGVFANVNEVSGFEANGQAIRTPNPAEVRAAAAFVDALHNEGVGAMMAAPASEVVNPKRVAVKITVGRKPQ